MYKLEVWQVPGGSIIRAVLPPEVNGTHFGAGLHALIHGFYASGMTRPAIFQFIKNVGIEISEGQVHHILMGQEKNYEEQSEPILSVGLPAREEFLGIHAGLVSKRLRGFGRTRSSTLSRNR